MTRPRKTLGLALPLASTTDERAVSTLVDDRPATMGVHLTISTMEPAYSVGDVALILPSDTVEAGSDYMLRRRGSNPWTYRLVRVDRVTATYIFARQFNPPMVRRMPRKLSIRPTRLRTSTTATMRRALAV